MDKKRFKISEHLYLDEIVPVKVYDKYAQANKLYKLAYKVPRQLIEAFEAIRIYIGKAATVNNWWNTYVNSGYNACETHKRVENSNSLYQWSGLRTPASTDYSVDSLHSSFKALDIKFFDVNLIHKAQQFVKDYWYKLKIGGLELKNGWMHIDIRYIPNQTKLMIF